MTAYSTRSLRGIRLFLRPSGPGRQLPKANPRTMLWVDPFTAFRIVPGESGEQDGA